MKRLLLAAVLVLAVVCGAEAADGDGDRTPFKYEMRFGYGGFPLYDNDNYDYHADLDFSDKLLSDCYGDYVSGLDFTGIFSAEFNFIFTKWFTLSLGAGADLMFVRYSDPVSRTRTWTRSGISVNVMPQARFAYVSKEYVKMYSAVGLGLYGGRLGDRSHLSVGWQVVPIGIMFGRKVFGFVEIGIGTMYAGGLAGVGFRF